MKKRKLKYDFDLNQYLIARGFIEEVIKKDEK